MNIRKAFLPLLLLLTPVAARSQSLTLPAMTPLAFLAGAWAVIALLGYCAWDYLQGGRK